MKREKEKEKEKEKRGLYIAFVLLNTSVCTNRKEFK
jgi:hypothetical protein